MDTGNPGPAGAPPLSRRYAPYDLRRPRRRIGRTPSYNEDIIVICEQLSRPLFGRSLSNPDNDAFSVPWRTVSRETSELREQFYLEQQQQLREDAEKRATIVENKVYESVFETARVMAERRASAIPDSSDKAEEKGKEVAHLAKPEDVAAEAVASNAYDDEDEDEDADYSPDAEAQDDEEEDILLTEIEPIDENDEVIEGVPSPVVEHVQIEAGAAWGVAEDTDKQSAGSRSIEVSEADSSGEETEVIGEDAASAEEQSAAVTGDDEGEADDHEDKDGDEDEPVPDISIRVVREDEEAEQDAGVTSDEADVDSDQATEEIGVMGSADEYSDGSTSQAPAQSSTLRTHSWWSLSSPRILRGLLASKQTPEESAATDENTEPSPASPAIRAQAQVQSLRRLPLTSTAPQTPLPYTPASFIDVSDGSCAAEPSVRRSALAKEWPGLRHSGSLIPSSRASAAATPRQAQTPRVTAASLGLEARRSAARGYARPPQRRACLYYGAGYGSQSTPYSSTITVVRKPPSAAPEQAEPMAAGAGSRSSITAQKILDIIGEVPPGRAQTADTPAFVNPYELRSPYAVRMRPATPQRRRELVPVSLRLSRTSGAQAKATTPSTKPAAKTSSVLDSIASAAPPAIQAKLAATPAAKQPPPVLDASIPVFTFALPNASAPPPPTAAATAASAMAMAAEPAHLPSFGFDLTRKPQPVPATTANTATTPSKSQSSASTWSQSVFTSAAPRSGEWTCDICELKNPNSASKCTVCDAAKLAPTTTTLSASSSWSQSVLASAAPKSGEWTCGICELKNPDSASKCTVCDTERSVPNPTAVKSSWSQSVLSSVSSMSGEWTCDTCELKNPDSASKCTVCDATKPAPKNAAVAATTLPPPPPVKNAWSQNVFASSSKAKSGEWTCDTCELKNPDTETKCTICDSPRPGAKPSASAASSWSASLLAASASKSGEWTCDTCELKNPGLSSKCTACDMPKPALSKSPTFQPAADSAKHKASTLAPFELPSFSFDLDVSKKPAFPGAAALIEWTCTVCELKNPGAATQCTICDAPR
ncbi:hypothetical protein EV175_000909 [Coemansia sp. RSA 1933]|nr:hypothetical protein EV175_000909 [Coemansia sp. RSA 1933]